MEVGTTVFFDFGKMRSANDVIRELDRFFADEQADLGGESAGISVKQFTPGSDSREYTFTSLKDWRTHLDLNERIHIRFALGRVPRPYLFFIADSRGGKIPHLQLNLTSTLEMYFLQDRILDFGEHELEDSLYDYKLCKRLFLALKAERCLGSMLDAYESIDGYGADSLFLFTCSGPQKLIRPLEERRHPRRGDTEEGKDDFGYAPGSDHPNWQRVINKPFDRISH